MTLHELSFGKIIILKEDIAEVIINHGVELTGQLVDEYHDFLCNHLQVPFSLLVNKIHDYSYNFAAQKKLAAIPEINSMAVVVYKQASERVTQLLTVIPREIDWNMKIFSDREMALAWVEDNQTYVRKRA